MKQLKKLVLKTMAVCLLAFLGLGEAAACDPVADSLQLVAFYEATGGDNWTNSWDLDQPMSTWYGVSRNGDGCVTYLEMHANNLVGTLPNLNLPYLGVLHCSWNHLTGTIPNLNLPSATFVDFLYSDLSGSIPDFSNMPNMTFLMLKGNNLTGSIPDFSNMPNMTQLRLENNNLSGSIPNFTNLPALRTFWCFGNAFSGSIPDFSNTPDLRSLGCSDNGLLTGNIPNFSNLPELREFSCSNNNLTGNIPDFSNVPKLTSFSCDRNNLGGSIPDFSNVPNLGYFRCYKNNFTGSIPDFSNTPKLKFLICNDNTLSGNIPDFYNTPILEELICYNNNLTGSIPNFTNTALLKRLYIYNNQLTGNIPDLINVPSLTEFMCHSNYLDGTIPDLTNNCPNLNNFRYQSNNFTFEDIFSSFIVNNDSINTHIYAGQRAFYIDTVLSVPIGSNYNIDLLIDEAITTNSYIWFKDGTQYGDTIVGSNKLPFSNVGFSDEGVYTCRVINPNIPGLTLVSQDITVDVVETCTYLDSLQLVDFYNNMTGNGWSYYNGGYYDYNPSTGGIIYNHNIPNEGNFWDFNEPIDTWHGVKVNANGCVEELVLNNCNLIGVLFSDLNLPELTELHLANNNISSTIPDFNSLDNLGYLNVNQNELTGNIPDFTNLAKLKFFDCSENNLIGNIPDFSNLPKLRTFLCSKNNLTGNIPDFTNVSKLRFFECNNNQLTGIIPDFINIPDLGRFLCNDNNLSNFIPDFSDNCPQLFRFINRQNNLTFENILPSIINNTNLCESNNQNWGDYFYYQQKPFYTDTTITINANEFLIVDLLIDEGIATNIYTWFKDGIPYDTIIGNNNLEFPVLSITDTGVYTCQVTNSGAPSLTLQSREIIINVLSNCALQDSLQLVNFYTATNGANWTIPWDLNQPMSTWHGVTLTPSGCVKKLELSNNNLVGNLIDFNLSELTQFHCSNNKLSGDIPDFSGIAKLINFRCFNNELTGDIPDFAHLPKLKFFFCNDNLLEEEVPDLSDNCPNLVRFYNRYNQFTFEDILPALANNSNNIDYIYVSQKPFFEDTVINLMTGDTLDVDLLIDEAVSNNSYQWEKNGQTYGNPIIGNNNLWIPSVSLGDAGVYRCKVSNPEAPNLVLVSWGIVVNIVSACASQDSLQLVDFYNAAGGPNWTNSWDLDSPMNTWYGVTLTADGCVQKLQLTNNNLVGNLIDFSLPELEEFYCENNQLTGSIPDFSGISNLFHFNCGYNQLTGNIPNFSNIPNLLYLRCYWNQLTGEIPDFSSLPNLWLFHCSANQLTGEIPDFTGIPNLRKMNCGANNLSGDIPDFSNIPNFDRLVCKDNQLTGGIPNFANIPHLEELYCENNQLTGEIPDFSNVANLEIFYVTNNQLTGEIPDFFNLPNLRIFSCSFNQLIGGIPDFSNLSNLEIFGCGDNQLSGNIPDFSNSPNLELFNCRSNDLVGNYPDFSDNCPNINRLFYNDNSLSFENILPFFSINNQLANINHDYYPQDSIFTDTLINTSTGETLTIDLLIDDTVTTNIYTWFKDGIAYNTITGNNELTISNISPTDAGIYSCEVINPNVPGLTLYSREITVAVSLSCAYNDYLQLVDFYNATNGANWIIPWDLTQPMSIWHGVTLTAEGCVKELDLSNNNLVGNLIDFNLSELEVFDCSDNALIGNIPDFSGIPNLMFFHCQENELSGNIPDFSNLPNLEVLDCRLNQLTGSIPNFSNIPELLVLDCSDNQLTGGIPDFINLPILAFADFQANLLTGNIANLNNNCPNLGGLNVNHNQLVFEDILNSINDNNTLTSGNYDYAPQDFIFMDTIINVAIGDSITVDLVVDELIADNFYQWFKDGIFYMDTIGDNNLNIPFVYPTDAGVYTCHIRNPNAPDLTLYSRQIIINVINACTYQDSLALVDFYNATNGNNWTSSWELNQPMNTWYGVVLNDNGCVQKLLLDNNNLTGELIDFNLYELKEFNCSNNNLIGNIPDYLGIPNLEYFYCSNNALSGHIANFGNLFNLEIFRASSNHLTGNIPDFVNLSELSSLNIQDNELTGSIPDFSDLIYFNCSENQFVFENIIDNIVANNAIYNYDYNPQGSIFMDTTINAFVGETINVDLMIDEDVANSIYEWDLNGIPYGTIIGNNNLEIDSVGLENDGIYICKITNPDAPDLTLYSKEITINVTNDFLLDSLILVDLYMFTGGMAWDTLYSDWLTEDSLSTWTGVTVSNDGRVTALSIPNGNMVGFVPESFTGLSMLESLDFSQNNLQSIPNLNPMTALSSLDISGNLLEQLEGLPNSITEIHCEDNYFQFGDLENYNALLTQSNSSYSPQFWNTEEEYYMQQEGTAMTLPTSMSGLNNEYQWYKDTVLLSNETALNYVIDSLQHMDEGAYHCEITNPLLPDLMFVSGNQFINVYDNFNSVVINETNDNYNIDVNTTYAHETIVVEADTIFINSGDTLFLDSSYIYICNHHTVICVEDTSMLSIVTSIIRPCHPDSSWQGIEVMDMSDIKIVKETEIYNARIAVSVTSPQPVLVDESNFINNGIGIRLVGINTQEQATNELIEYNDFTLTDAMPQDIMPPYYGIELEGHLTGEESEGGGVANNFFRNNRSISCLEYCGIKADNSGGNFENNSYVDMYCGIDMNNPNTKSSVVGDQFIHSKALPKDCVSTQFNITNSTKRLNISNLEMSTPPIFSNDDKIFIGLSASNSTRVKLSFSDFSNFDHNVALDDSGDVSIKNNTLWGGLVGAYMENMTRKMDFSHNDVGGGILCRVVYRLDESVRNDLDYDGLKNLTFECNAFLDGKPGSDGGDHDEDYDMRMMTCDDSTITSNCIPLGASSTLELPMIENNYRESDNIEFINELTTDPLSSIAFIMDATLYESVCNQALPRSNTDLLGEMGNSKISPVSKLYPNPTNGLLHMDYSSENDLHIQVVDLMGRIMSEKMLTQGSGTATLYLTDLSQGIYSIRILDDFGGVWIEKFIKM